MVDLYMTVNGRTKKTWEGMRKGKSLGSVHLPKGEEEKSRLEKTPRDRSFKRK